MTIYRVLNPDNLPAGIPLVAFTQRWCEGDEFEPPAGMNVAELVASGHLVEAAAYQPAQAPAPVAPEAEPSAVDEVSADG